MAIVWYAGGSAKQARDRAFQAVLPLRGKILNVERKDDAALYLNNEIASLIVALGLGLKGEANVNLRYGKVSLPGPFQVFWFAALVRWVPQKAGLLVSLVRKQTICPLLLI